MDDAKRAVERLFEEFGAGYCFPSDKIWEALEEDQALSLTKQQIIRRLSGEGYIARTGRVTRAVSKARKGAPTNEYTFGPSVSPISLDLATRPQGGSSSNEALGGSIDGIAVPENADGRFPLEQPLQRVVHGCPGSGKSYTLQNEAKAAHYVIRTVFHPESSYSDFVGGLRPQSIYKLADEEPTFVGSTIEVPGEPYVQYVVQTGPLLKAYQLACLHADKSVVLIVEELSRAVAAHVFGDTLQLLDRVEADGDEFKGYSAYEIEPRPDISAWLAFNEVWNDGVGVGRMRFPPNLYIWATMNRADQNARQLDAAFLRRFQKQYLSYLSSGAYDDALVKYAGVEISWNKLRGAVNEKLKLFEGVPEDKFIGPYMLPKRHLSDPDAIYEDLWGYLWNDVLRTRAPSFFNGTATFAEVGKIWNSGNGSPIGPIIA
jgi:hypothetical protein